MLTVKEIKKFVLESDKYNELIATNEILCAFIGGSYKNGLFVDGVSDYDVILIYDTQNLILKNPEKPLKTVYDIGNNVHLILQPRCIATGSMIRGYHFLAVLSLKKTDMIYINEDKPEFANYLLKLSKTDISLRKRYFALSTIVNYWYELYSKYSPANLNCMTPKKEKIIFRQLFISMAIYFEKDYIQYAAELDAIKHGTISPKIVSIYRAFYQKLFNLSYIDIITEYNKLSDEYRSLL